MIFLVRILALWLNKKKKQYFVTDCIFLRKFTIYQKLEITPQPFCVYWKHNSRPTSLCWHVQAVYHHIFCKG